MQHICTSFSCCLLSKSCMGARESSGVLSLFRISFSFLARALLILSMSLLSSATLGSSGALLTTADKGGGKQKWNKCWLWQLRLCRSVVIQFLKDVFLSPACLGRITSTVGVFRESISADLRLFRSASLPSRLNRHITIQGSDWGRKRGLGDEVNWRGWWILHLFKVSRASGSGGGISKQAPGRLVVLPWLSWSSQYLLSELDLRIIVCPRSTAPCAQTNTAQETRD